MLKEYWQCRNVKLYGEDLQISMRDIELCRQKRRKKAVLRFAQRAPVLRIP